MGKNIAFAHVMYRDDPKRFRTVPICDVKYKKNSESHIVPTNEDDFIKRQVYYVAWRDCDEQTCEEEHQHVGYYPAFVLLLGESVEEIRTKADERRLIVPHGVESSESEENVIKSRKTKRATPIQDVQKKKNEEILEKYNGKAFLLSRKKFDDSDEEPEAKKATSRRLEKIEETERNDTIAKDGSGEDGEDNGERNHVTTPVVESLRDQKGKLEIELQNKSKEIAMLREMILQFQDKSNCSQLSTDTRGNPDAGAVTVRRDLFGAGGHEAEEKKTKGCKLSIRSVEKVNVTISNVNKNKAKEIERPLRSQSPDLQANDDDSRLSQGNIEIGHGQDQSGCSGQDDSHKKKGIQANKQVEIKLQRQLRKRLPSESGNNNEEIPGDSTDEDDGEEVQPRRTHLEPKMKQRKRNDMDKQLNKKIMRDITEALQFYENQEVDEHGRKLYDITGDRIYLGEGIQVSVNTWFFIQHNKPTIFLRDMIEIIWGQRKLVNRCQNSSKTTVRLSDRSPVKPLTPEKKRLTYKLYSDFLETKKIAVKERMKLLQGVPQQFSKKIQYLRSKYYE